MQMDVPVLRFAQYNYYDRPEIRLNITRKTNQKLFIISSVNLVARETLAQMKTPHLSINAGRVTALLYCYG